jgi:hypothetical protein
MTLPVVWMGEADADLNNWPPINADENIGAIGVHRRP